MKLYDIYKQLSEDKKFLEELETHYFEQIAIVSFQKEINTYTWIYHKSELINIYSKDTIIHTGKDTIKEKHGLYLEIRYSNQNIHIILKSSNGIYNKRDIFHSYVYDNGEYKIPFAKKTVFEGVDQTIKVPHLLYKNCHFDKNKIITIPVLGWYSEKKSDIQTDKISILDLLIKENKLYVQFVYNQKSPDKTNFSHKLNQIPKGFKELIQDTPKVRIQTTDSSDIFLLKYISNAKKLPKQLKIHKYTTSNLFSQIHHLIFMLHYLVIDNTVIYTPKRFLSFKFQPGIIPNIKENYMVYFQEIIFLRKSLKYKPRKTLNSQRLSTYFYAKKGLFNIIKYFIENDDIPIPSKEKEFCKLLTDYGIKKWKKKK